MCNVRRCKASVTSSASATTVVQSDGAPPFDSTPLRMGNLHITIAVVVGLAVLWAVNVRYDNFRGVMRRTDCDRCFEGSTTSSNVRRARSNTVFRLRICDGRASDPEREVVPTKCSRSAMSDAPSPETR